LKAYDNRLYVVENGTLSIPVGFNGFTRLTLRADLLNIDYYSLALDPNTGKLSPTTSSLLVSETWYSDRSSGDVVQRKFDIINKDITIVTHED